MHTFAVFLYKSLYWCHGYCIQSQTFYDSHLCTKVTQLLWSLFALKRLHTFWKTFLYGPPIYRASYCVFFLVALLIFFFLFFIQISLSPLLLTLPLFLPPSLSPSHSLSPSLSPSHSLSLPSIIVTSTVY